MERSNSRVSDAILHGTRFRIEYLNFPHETKPRWRLIIGIRRIRNLDFNRHAGEICLCDRSVGTYPEVLTVKNVSFIVGNPSEYQDMQLLLANNRCIVTNAALHRCINVYDTHKHRQEIRWHCEWHSKSKNTEKCECNRHPITITLTPGLLHICLWWPKK